MSTGRGNSLIARAASGLRPPIFSHPVWVRFGGMEGSTSRKLVDELLCAAGRLEDDDPSGACQILLISAVYQNYGGRRDDALRTAQQALALAERNGLAEETIWAAWGACAVCFQAANFEQATRYLEYLRARLNEQNEWMLADFAEVVEHALPHLRSAGTAERSGWKEDRSAGDLLCLTFDRLRHWGASDPVVTSKLETHAGSPIIYVLPEEEGAHPSLAHDHGRGIWQSLVRAIKGELSLQWVERDHQHVMQESLAGLAVSSSIESDPSGRMHESPTGKHAPQLPLGSVPPSLVEESPVDIHSHKTAPASRLENGSGPATAVRMMVVQMLGPLSLTVQDSPLRLPGSRSSSLLKYLLIHHNQDIPREILMDVFWPDADPGAARNNLNVALHRLRQALRTVTDTEVLRFEDGAYGLSADFDVWLDVDEFERCIQDGRRLEARGQLAAAVIQYELAVELYRGDFLADSPYEAWTDIEREHLRVAYMDTLERLIGIHFRQERYAACVTLCRLLLSRDPCREDTHCRLMQCYSRLGQGPLALRQYQSCVEALHVELEANPAPETTSLYNRIRRHDQV